MPSERIASRPVDFNQTPDGHVLSIGLAALSEFIQVRAPAGKLALPSLDFLIASLRACPEDQIKEWCKRLRAAEGSL